MAIEAINEIKSASYFPKVSSVKPIVSIEKVESAINNSERERFNSKESNSMNRIEAENSQNPSYYTDNQEEKADKTSGETSMKSATQDMNKIINKNTVAEFGYHEATHRVTIKIKDKNTNETIKEIPSEKALEMLEKAWEIAGILVDEKR